jgi:hypothetical protein
MVWKEKSGTDCGKALFDQFGFFFVQLGFCVLSGPTSIIIVMLGVFGEIKTFSGKDECDRVETTVVVFQFNYRDHRN